MNYVLVKFRKKGGNFLLNHNGKYFLPILSADYLT